MLHTLHGVLTPSPTRRSAVSPERLDVEVGTPVGTAPAVPVPDLRDATAAAPATDPATGADEGADEGAAHDVSRTMDDIDALLREVCDDLSAGWATRVPDAVDVLDADLPETLLGWLLPATGKRLRPLMCHWGWVSAGGAAVTAEEPDPCRTEMVRVGAALELLHLFALVHDDVMDRGSSRRGRPTAHVEAARAHVQEQALGDPVLFGDSVAILLGDLALSEASLLVTETSRPVQLHWREMLRELVHGQLLDVTAAAARRRDVEHSRRVARLKSGAYTIQRPLVLGALVAGAPAPVTDALEAYGAHLGEAFALRDDVLGVWGDPLTTGKPVGDDLLLSKATVLLAEARRLLPPDLSERYLGRDAHITPEDVPVLQQLMVERGVLDVVEGRIDRELELALECLSQADLEPVGARRLQALAESTARRAA
ncbi:geranylgeranyl diphosphate synthase type I [Terracoccus luteus]|uniref:Geranylgeranyl diphosphate synthase type I n=1 Tax=Terracoccus luteus TaxID=53356 RepID=A0A495XVM8_9MICO|nr:geranylgeranyl diphosphate synthase type I [Terracoccus luteus]